MSSVFAGAMITIMALCFFGVAIPLGGVNPELVGPAYTLLAFLGLLWAGKCFFWKDLGWNASPMHWPVAVFVVYSIIRYFFCPVEYDARIELFQVGACGLVYFVCATMFHRPVDRVVFLVALMVLAVLESGYGIWQALTQTDTVFGWLRPEGYRGRGSGTFIYPNHFSAFLELALGLVLARAALVRRESKFLERSVILKVLTVYVALMIVAGIVISRSRAGWVATIVGLLLFAFLGDWRPRLSWPRLGLVAVVIAAMGLTLWNVEYVRNHLERTVKVDEKTKAITLNDPSLGGRLHMWNGTLAMIRDHPVIGTGMGSWQWVHQRYKNPAITSRPVYAHNDFLHLVSDYGLIGGTLMVWVFVGFWRHARALCKRGEPPEKQAFAVGAIVSVAAILAHSWFDFNLHVPANAMLLAGILGFTAAMETADGRFTRRPVRFPGRFALGFAVLLFCAIGMRFFIPTALAARYTDLGNRLKTSLDYDLAADYYGRAIALDPENPEPHSRTGDILRRWADFRIGEDKLEERAKYALAAVGAYDASLQLNPYQSFVLVDKAHVHGLAGQNDLAQKSYARAIEVYPSNGFAHLRQGCFFRDHGDTEGARAAFEESIRYANSQEAQLNLYYLDHDPDPDPEPEPDAAAEPESQEKASPSAEP